MVKVDPDYAISDRDVLNVMERSPIEDLTIGGVGGERVHVRKREDDCCGAVSGIEQKAVARLGDDAVRAVAPIDPARRPNIHREPMKAQGGLDGLDADNARSGKRPVEARK